jgi:hypothetical protein
MDKSLVLGSRPRISRRHLVEVGPSSFSKIKMLGKGDVGRVYLVREKKSDKLYAMKGNKDFSFYHTPLWRGMLN